MSAQDSLRAALLKAAADVLLTLESAAPAEPPEPVVWRGDGWEVRVVAVRVRGGNGEAVPPGPGGNGEAGVTGEIADQLRAVLTRAEKPLKMSQLATRARRQPTNHFRDIVHRMTLAGELLHLANPHRYWLASRPLPGQ